MTVTQITSVCLDGFTVGHSVIDLHIDCGLSSALQVIRNLEKHVLVVSLLMISASF